MKKLFLAVLFLLACTSSAWSLTILSNTVDVGDVDSYLGASYISNSNPEGEELTWVRSILGDDVDWIVRTEGEDMTWYEVDGSEERIYAFNLVNDNVGYFLVKTGSTASGNNVFLFENISDLTWAVINLDLTDILSIKNVGKLSHIDELDTTPVPEPGTLLLLGTALIGIAGFRKKTR